MFSLVKRFLRNEAGATALEYGMIVALIAVAILVTVDLIGGQILANFQAVTDRLAAAGTTRS